MQKALDSGVAFTSNQVNYQLISGGRAIAKSNNSAPARSAHSSASNLWSGEHGPYLVSIGANGRSSNSSLSSRGVDFRQIAFNPETGNVAVISGNIVVKIKPNYSAESIAATYNINLTDNFEDISFAWYQVTTGQNIFTIAQNLRGHPGVVTADIEVREDYRQAR